MQISSWLSFSLYSSSQSVEKGQLCSFPSRKDPKQPITNRITIFLHFCMIPQTTLHLWQEFSTISLGNKILGLQSPLQPILLILHLAIICLLNLLLNILGNLNELQGIKLSQTQIFYHKKSQYSILRTWTLNPKEICNREAFIGNHSHMLIFHYRIDSRETQI